MGASNLHLGQLFRRIILLSSREESFEYFEEVAKIVQGLDEQVYPTTELQWLMVTAWNNGVYFFR